MGCFPGKLGTAERHRTGKASTGRCCPNGSSERYSSLHCYLPLTTNVQPRATFLRVHLRAGEAGLREKSDILVDQIRAIDNRRFLRRTGKISRKTRQCSPEILLFC